MSKYFYINADLSVDQWNKKLTTAEILLDIEERLTALERGETKPQQEPPKYKGATCRGSYVLGTACGLCERCEDEKRRMVVASKPTPATVERFNAFRFAKTWGVDENKYTKEPIGEVVARKENFVDCWHVNLPGKELRITTDEYRALVDHNTKSGIWERQA